MHSSLSPPSFQSYHACAAEFLGVNSYDREWYCFRYRQEPNSRTTKAGYYKVTGKGSKIKDRQQEEIGTKTFLVYYTGRTPNGVKTSWKMHEITATCLPDHQVCACCYWTHEFKCLILIKFIFRWTENIKF